MRTANEDFTGQSVRVMRFMATMSPALTIFVNIGIVLVIWAGGAQAIRGDLTVGQIVAFTNYLLTTMTPADHDDACCRTSGPTASPRPSASTRSWTPSRRSRMCPARRPCPTRPGRAVVFEDVSFHYNGGGG